MKFNYEGTNIDITLDETHVSLMKWAKTNKTFKEEPFLRYLKDNKIIDSNSVVMDIGSFIGNHVIYYSKIIGVSRVIAFEPTLRSFNILNKNLNKNSVNNVHLFNAAIGQYGGFAECNIRKETNPAKNQWFETPEAGLNSVITMTINDFLHEPIDFIKIDIEGMEMFALRGGIDLIDSKSPVLMVEVMKENLFQFELLMAKLGYSMIGEDVFTLHKDKKANTLLYKRK